MSSALALSACGNDSSADLETEVVANYADVVHETYSMSLASATEMGAAIDALAADPTDANLAAAKDAWLAARDDYGLTEAFRFYGGPIDAVDTGPEGLINAWPLDEAYIDYVEDAPESGVVNLPDEYPTIDADLLVSLNEAGGETNISTGWHAIEFLLWGQDLSTDGAGARPVTDFTTSPNADRRVAYLTVASDLLVGHLQSLVDAWAPDVEDNSAPSSLR
jgi:putative iron-regulated protein